MTRFVLGELPSEAALLAAARELKARGFEDLELHTPFPIEGAEDVLHLGSSRLPAACFVAGLLGASGAFLIQWYTNAIDWPLVSGGHPLNAAPAFVPIVFETGVLCAAGAAFFGALWGSGLPRLVHPVFDADGFSSATQAGFWICVGAEDDAGIDRAQRTLTDMGAAHISQVEGRR